MKLHVKKMNWLLLVLVVCMFLSGCSDDEDKTGEVTPGSHTQTLTLHDETIVEAKVTYNPGLTLAIEGDEVVVSEDAFANLDPSQHLVIDLQVTEQAGRTNPMILLSVETEDETYGSQLYLWVLEYFEHGKKLRQRQMWELDDESTIISYHIAEGSNYFALRDGDYYELQLGIDRFGERFTPDELPELHPVIGRGYRGEVELSPPIDFLLDDLITEGQKDLIVRHEVIGPKPEWFPYEYVMQVYTMQQGEVTLAGQYGSNEDIHYSRKDVLPTYTATYDELTTDDPQIIVETSSKLDRDSLERALSSTMTSNDPSRTAFEYDLTWANDDHQVTIRLNDVRAGEVIQFELDQLRNWLDRPVKRADLTTPANIVFGKMEEEQSYVHVTDVQTLETSVYPAPLARQVYMAEDVQAGVKKIFVATDEGPLLLEPDSGELQPLPYAADAETFDPNRWKHFYPDRFFTTSNFVVEDLTTLYRIDADGGKTEIWKAPEDRVVYGYAVSPKGSRIALIYNQEEWKGSFGNLLILDLEGSELATVTQATFSQKSDGIVPKIALEWKDEQTVHIPTNIYVRGLYEKGTKIVTLHDDHSVTMEEIIDEDGYTDTQFVPSPTGDYVVEYSSTKLMMLVNQQNGERIMLGSGYFLGWLDAHRVAWYVSPEEGYPLPDAIF